MNRVDIDYVLYLKKELQHINSFDLERITWTRKGEAINFDNKDINSWKYTGLSNTDFAEMFGNSEYVK